jgi:hypothetical protein
MLLPPLATGRCRSHPDDVAGGWVYVTPTRSLAETYAATCRGWVYEVAPIGVVERDPGSMLPPGESLRCRAARIVRRFRLSRADCERMAAIVGMFGHVD